MDITISVSDKAVENIRVRAEENGKAVNDFIEEFVEENFANGTDEKPERKHNLLAFAGMFNSGKTDTSEQTLIRRRALVLDELMPDRFRFFVRPDR